MAITLSSEQFNRQLPEAAQAARTETVIFAEDGTATHVLMSYAEYRRLIDEGPTLAEAFSTVAGEGLSAIPDEFLEDPYCEDGAISLSKSA